MGKSLNPCCNGICSRSHATRLCVVLVGVLILVVMEYALGEVIKKAGEKSNNDVLILVVMEYALGAINLQTREDFVKS